MADTQGVSTAADPAAQLERLVTLAMPFGKYQGQLLADLPSAYLVWFAKKGFPKGELGRLLALMHELDHNGLSSLLIPLRQRPRSLSETSPTRSKGNSP